MPRAQWSGRLTCRPSSALVSVLQQHWYLLLPQRRCSSSCAAAERLAGV
jgi:hypothetical protein